MITKPQVLQILKETCPSFQTDEEELLYVVLGDFTRHLLELHQQQQTELFPAVAQAIERLHAEGDSYVRELATIGLLESIQNVWGNNQTDPELFGTYLLPESRRWWDELNAFWRGERRYIGEGLQREITAEDIRQLQEERRAHDEKLRREREGAA